MAPLVPRFQTLHAPKDFFDAHGFVSLPGFLDANETARLERDLVDCIHCIVPGLADHEAFYENRDDPTTLKQIQHLELHDERFAARMFHSRFEALAADLLGEPVVGKNLQFFNKVPHHSRPTPPHQDGFYFMLEPCRAVTMWLAIDAADTANGCMQYLPDSHRDGLRAHVRSDTLGFSQTIANFPTDAERTRMLAMTATPGQLIAHDARLIHSAGHNRTADRQRRAIGFIYYGASAREDAERHAAYQAKLTAELRAKGEI